MKNKLIVITGASSGLGAAMAQLFSQSGYYLALLARRMEPMEALKLPNTFCQTVDVTHAEVFKEVIHLAEKHFDTYVDCLVNNAGVVKRGDFENIEPHQFKEMVDINVTGVVNGIQVVLPSMQKRKGGTIINISSLSDRNSRPNNPVYAATKSAVKSLTESLRMANAKYGIRFCNLAPAKIHSPMWDQKFDPNHFISPEDFAKMVLWIYEQPQNICIRDLVIAPTDYEP